MILVSKECSMTVMGKKMQPLDVEIARLEAEIARLQGERAGLMRAKELLLGEAAPNRPVPVNAPASAASA